MAASRRASWCSGAATPTARSARRSARHFRGCRARPSTTATRPSSCRAPSAPAFDVTLLQRLPRATAAAAAVLRYARATQPGAELPLVGLQIYARTDTLIIDEQARAHLELVESLQDRRRAGSLIDLLDETRTAMGGRLLRRWLLFPSVELATIRRRHDAVERLVGAHAARDRARKELDGIADIERLVGRARLGVATPRDLAVLGRSLAALPALAEALGEAHAGEIGGSLAGEPDLLRLGDGDETAGRRSWRPSSRASFAPTRRRSPRTAAT